MGLLRDVRQRLWLALRKLFALGGSCYLSDTCKWDYGDACSRPERPNAKTCPDYQRR